MYKGSSVRKCVDCHTRTLSRSVSPRRHSIFLRRSWVRSFVCGRRLTRSHVQVVQFARCRMCWPLICFAHAASPRLCVNYSMLVILLNAVRTSLVRMTSNLARGPHCIMKHMHSDPHLATENCGSATHLTLEYFIEDMLPFLVYYHFSH